MVKDRPGRILLAWAFVGSLIAALCYFSLGHYDHNDHMYAVAPVLAQHLRLYSEIAFVQTPLSALIYSEIYKIVDEQHFYLTLRIFSLALQVAIVLFGVAFCCRHATRRLFASVLFVCLYVSYRPADIIGAEIGNYTLALALTAAGFTILDLFRGRPWTPFAVGTFAGLALSTKLSYIYMVFALGLVYLIWERSPQNPLVRMAAYAVGVLVGIVPILYYLVLNPGLFLFENVHFHYLSNIYRGNAPFPWLSNLAYFSVSSAVVPLTLLFVGCATAWGAALLIARLWPPARILAVPLTVLEKEMLCVAAAAVIGAITPGVIFQQYFAAPAFAIFLFAAFYVERLSGTDRFLTPWRDWVGQGVLVLAVVLSVLRAYALTYETILRQREGIFAITAVARARQDLATVIAAINRAHPGCHGDLVTAFGVPAIGAGATFARIDATGAFAMRLDNIFATKAPAYRWMSNPLLYLTPRSLILSGFYTDTLTEPTSPFEKTLDGYAVNHGFEPIPLGNFLYRSISLYIPPGCRIPQSVLSSPH